MAQTTTSTCMEEVRRLLVCPICLNDYSEMFYVPKTLICGHTFCTICITSFIENRQPCPFCRQEIPPASSASDFSVSYALLELVRTTNSAAPPVSPEDEEVIPQIENIKDRIKNRLAMVKSKLHNTLSEVVRLSKRADDLEDKQKTLNNWLQSFNQMKDDLMAARSISDVFNRVQEINEVLMLAEDYLENGNFDSDVVSTETYPLESTSSAAEEVMEEEAASVIHLCSEFYGYYDSEIGRLWSSVEICGNKLLFHSLSREQPSGNIKMVKIPSIEESGCIALSFLDLWWSEAFQGRVFLRMFGQTARAHQFLLLCMGAAGPSYKGSIFYRADNVGEPGEIISGGDYENNNGTGGTSVVNIVSGPEYQRSIVPGLLVGWPAEETYRGGSFEIYLSEHPGFTEYAAFGIVESGLAVLKSAARHSQITDVTIKQCGIVFEVN